MQNKGYIFILAIVAATVLSTTTSCQRKLNDMIAPEGDTVEQKRFLPADTAAINAKKRALQAKKDSIFADSLVRDSILQDSLMHHGKRHWKR